MQADPLARVDAIAVKIFLDGLDAAGGDPRKLDMDAMRAQMKASITPEELALLRADTEARNSRAATVSE